MEAIHAAQPYDVSRSPITLARSRLRINVHRNERIVSSLLGGIVLARGLAHRSPFNTMLCVLGSALVLRGVSGHCQLYQALGLDTAS